MVICLERGADLHMAQLMPLPLTVSCFSKIQIGLHFWYRLTRVVPEKGPLNGCVCVCVCSCIQPTQPTAHFTAIIQVTCVSQHLQLRTRGFCWCKVLLSTCPCWRQPAHLDWVEDAGVLLNSVNYTVSIPQHVYKSIKSTEDTWAHYTQSIYSRNTDQPAKMLKTKVFCWHNVSLPHAIANGN